MEKCNIESKQDVIEDNQVNRMWGAMTNIIQFQNETIWKMISFHFFFL